MNPEPADVAARRILGVPNTGTPGAWRAICLSHAPAIVIDANSGGYTSLEAAVDEIEASRGRPHTRHPGCDLLIGWFTQPGYDGGTLTGVVCPPGSRPTGLCDHDHPVTVEAHWLALLAAVVPHDRSVFLEQGDPLIDAIKQVPTCWVGDRIGRLRPLLAAPRG